MTIEVQTISIGGVDDLLGVVPSLLGFMPRDSLVLLVSKEGRLVVTARAWLSDLVEAGDVGASFAPLWGRFPDAEAFAIAYTPDASLAWWVLARFEESLPLGNRVASVHADGSRWFDHPDAEGVPYDPDASVAACEATMAGMIRRHDRSELAALLESAADADEAEQALEAVADLGEEVAARASETFHRLLGSDEPVTFDEASLLAFACQATAFHDEAALAVTRETAGRALEIWRGVLRQSSPLVAGASLCQAGLAAWVTGDGATLSIALERVLSEFGGAPWFHFLDDVQRYAVPPDLWQTIRQEYLVTSLEPAAPHGLAP